MKAVGGSEWLFILFGMSLRCWRDDEGGGGWGILPPVVGAVMAFAAVATGQQVMVSTLEAGDGSIDLAPVQRLP
jgi:hypothetical protein